MYGPVRQDEKDMFWEDLASIGKVWVHPWIVTGDFNVMRKRSKRSSSRAIRYERQKFAEFVDEFGLLELDRVGMDFTFKNSQDPPFSRLFRPLVNLACLEILKIM